MLYQQILVLFFFIFLITHPSLSETCLFIKDCSAFQKMKNARTLLMDRSAETYGLLVSAMKSRKLLMSDDMPCIATQKYFLFLVRFSSSGVNPFGIRLDGLKILWCAGHGSFYLFIADDHAGCCVLGKPWCMYY